MNRDRVMILLVAFHVAWAWDLKCLVPGACDTKKKSRDKNTTKSTPTCSLYLGESNYGGLGMYSGVDMKIGDIVAEPDIVIPVIDANKNQWNFFWSFLWTGDLNTDALLESWYSSELIIPGVASHAKCPEAYSNVKVAGDSDYTHDNAGVHRRSDPTVGSFSYRHNHTNAVTRSIQAGEELFLEGCDAADEDKADEEEEEQTPPAPASLKWLKKKALCMDGLRPGNSTLQGAGRGAFAKHVVPTGHVVTYSPVVAIPREQMDIVDQHVDKQTYKIAYTDKKWRTQLLLNYCFGQKDSDVLLLPTGPVVNFINHDEKEPNVKIQWSSTFLQPSELLKMSPFRLFKETKTLIIEYVALRDIEEGEELFLDYGQEWQNAWSQHSKMWPPTEKYKNSNYINPTEFTRINAKEDVRTVKEQKTDPYPSNLQTSCYYIQTEDNEVDEMGDILWTGVNDTLCLRPCDIIARKISDRPSKDAVYTAVMHNIEMVSAPANCEIDNDATVRNIPREKIVWTDKAYKSDLHLKHAFRHEIGAPGGLFPSEWLVKADASAKTSMSIDSSELKPNEIAPMIIAETGQIATKYGYRMGVPEKLTSVLQTYCDEMGITKAFHSLLLEGLSLKAGASEYVRFNGDKWYIQRPAKKWTSNMHWISPADDRAQFRYLRALSDGGFDELLAKVGEYFGMDGLVCYHLTFVGVSHSEKSYLHYDNKLTGGKVFNVIIPLKLANETDPELDVRADDGTVAGYKYKFGEATLIGDDAYHGTAAVDYREAGEMRVAATIYMADVNPKNAEQIMMTYTQVYPPQDADRLLSSAGSHWKADDITKQLPKLGDPEPEASETFLVKASELKPNEIAPMLLQGTDERLTENLYRANLPDELTTELLAFCDRMGITEKFRSLLIDGPPHEPGHSEYMEQQGVSWYVQRPQKRFKSNMHWISPGDEGAQTKYLQALGAGGFDTFLKSLGNYLGMDGLVCYHLTFIGVTYSRRSFVHYDFKKTDGKAFNIIIPLLLVNDTEPELDVRSTDKKILAGYQYRYGEASVIGDNAYHGTAAVNYLGTGQMRMCATVYIADVNADNVDGILADYTQAYPPSNATRLLSQAGIHWKRDDPSKRLPTYDAPDECSLKADGSCPSPPKEDE